MAPPEPLPAAELQRRGRGGLRAWLLARGTVGHSGGGTATPNAITKAAALVSSLEGAELPADGESAFPLPPEA
jgi:hypothetical protein